MPSGSTWASRLGSALRSVLRPSPTAPPTPRRPARPAYQGDFMGTAAISYAPHPDGVADPGEVVWAWVPFEEDHARGKDRPVLIVSRDGDALLGLMLTSRDHDQDPPSARHGESWLDLGAGAWDRQGRPSEVRLDRVLRLDPTSVRREGAALDRARFDQVASRLRESPRWR